MRAWPPPRARWARTNILRKEVGHAAPYAGRGRRLRPTCDTLVDSLNANHGAMLVRRAWPRLLRAADIFGFHLASLDMRQTFGRARARAGRPVRAAPASRPTTRRSTKTPRSALLLGELAQPRLLYLAVHRLQRRDRCPSWRSCARRARSASATARARSATTSSRTPKTVSDLLEVLLLQKETGLLRTAGEARRRLRTDGDPAVRNHPRPAARGRHHGAWMALAAGQAADRQAGPAAGSHARLFRLEQGWRLPDLELGAVQGRTDAGRRVRAAPASSCACSTAAAARSAVAAVRATRRSWPSRRAPSTARSA